MSARYNDDFKREVVRAYTAGGRSIAELAAEYNIAKSTISEWQKNMVKNSNTKIPLKKSTKVILQVKSVDSTRFLKKKIKRLSS